MGALTLGSRLKRLADTLYRQVSEAVEPAFAVAPNQVPILACLDHYGPQGVTELTRRMGLSQPAITRMAGALAEAGLVVLGRADEDQRQTVVRLSQAGEALAARMRTDLWPRVRAAAASLYEGGQGDFLAQIGHVEGQLQARSFALRMAAPTPQAAEP